MEVKVLHLHTRQNSTVRTCDKCRWHWQEGVGPGKIWVSNLSEQKFPSRQIEEGRNSLHTYQPRLWEWHICSVYLVNKKIVDHGVADVQVILIKFHWKFISLAPNGLTELELWRGPEGRIKASFLQPFLFLWAFYQVKLKA